MVLEMTNATMRFSQPTEPNLPRFTVFNNTFKSESTAMNSMMEFGSPSEVSLFDNSRRSSIKPKMKLSLITFLLSLVEA